MTPKHRVVICGAGITGLSAAYFLTKAGVSDVLLVDERPPLSLTSDRSTECYRNWWPDPELRALMDRSIDLMEQLARESANRIRLNRRGYLYVSADPAETDKLVLSAQEIAIAGGGRLRIHSGHSSSYIPSAPEDYLDQPDGADLLLGASVVNQRFPYLTNSAAAALHVRRAGWLSAQQMGMYFLEQARAQGADFLGGRICAVQITDNRVRAITLEGGEDIECAVFVNAAGPYFKDVGAFCGLDLPVHTDLHLKVAFADTRRVLDRGAPLLIWNDPIRLPWLPDERAMLQSDPATSWLNDPLPGGAHTRPEGAGDGTAVLMLWDYKTRSAPPVFPPPLDDQYPEVVLRGLAVMVPELRTYFGRAARPHLDGGYYVKTPENRLLVGPTPVEGVFVIGAVSGYGIMSACAAGELLAAHVVGAHLPSYAGAFDLDRYDDPDYLKNLQWAGEGEL